MSAATTPVCPHGCSCTDVLRTAARRRRSAASLTSRPRSDAPTFPRQFRSKCGEFYQRPTTIMLMSHIKYAARRALRVHWHQLPQPACTHARSRQQPREDEGTACTHPPAGGLNTPIRRRPPTKPVEPPRPGRVTHSQKIYRNLHYLVSVRQLRIYWLAV